MFDIIIASKHERKLGEFETVMQTKDAVKGLHNCQEFRVWILQTRKKVIYCFCKIFLNDNSTNDGKCRFYSLIETDFLDTCSYFLPGNQNDHIWQYITNKNLFDVRVVFPYSHLNTAIDQWECAYYPNYFVNTNRRSVKFAFTIFVDSTPQWR